MSRLFIPMIAIAVAGCATGDRQLETPHQPVVRPDLAYVPGCPDWTDANRPATREGQGTNYGCATMANLAAMVADPADLLRGRSSGSNSPETATKAIRSWRDAEPTSKSWTTTTAVSVGGTK